MSPSLITYIIIATMVVLFVTNLIPTAVTAVLVTLALYATGILDLGQALRGFGDPTVLFIASLLVISASLDATGVTAWAGQALITRTGSSRLMLVALTTVAAAFFTALVGVSGAVAALLPVAILVSVRLGRPPSQLLLPMVFAAHAGSMLVLTSSLVNLVISDAATRIGLPPLGFFEPTLVGIPLVAGTIVIVVLLGERLLPVRHGRMIPDDLSRHYKTLVEQYDLSDGLFRLEIRPRSPYVGQPQGAIWLEDFPGLSLVAVQGPDGSGPPRQPVLAAGDLLLVRGDAKQVDHLAAAMRLQVRERDTSGVIDGALFNTTAGLAEVVIPPRSGLIGESMFPGMVTSSGDLIVLAIQRRGETLRSGETVLAAGDTLLLQGNWKALDKHLQDPDVLVVNSPDLVRRQAVPMGAGSKRAVFVLAALVVMLATGAAPPVFAGLLCACAVILLRVLTVEQAFRAINWTAIVMIASLMPLATAMYQTGAAGRMADALVSLCGDRSQYSLLAALFILTAGLAQLLSSTATALMMIPVATAAATEIGFSPRTALMTVAVAAAASFLTPIAGGANMMVQGPGGYRFGDYAKLGWPLMLWFFFIAIVVVPVFWPA
ncbi:SLC13 family permease [Rhodopila sp.]|jgi:di/tricarboxylate transporter|uniref:SLC13 family permease n=1 Tax=Rhodopila sp. TaxID=2480087 RepID=UPI002BFFBDC9|nr:SLC13 family permease [Rhodopila sp.]HVZ08682.1 SLC13 family permease [Rhodopila sp.]